MVGDMTENEQLGKLAEESLRRKERLMHLKEKACKESNKRINDEGITKPVFRSYKPQNEITPCQIIPKMAAGDIEEVVGNQLD
ncbi:uncharacterized protein LOC131995125 [Stomoxys calcitrans]|uniref:uncharacterized protein LOC131995125 n=1 Tax=Stomoxys calcitrans TaxID=35570 RepID=UPI0027E2876A|nr:uncharacterized protein LOC131995125 [Stomoxys calcitrans]